MASAWVIEWKGRDAPVSSWRAISHGVFLDRSMALDASALLEVLHAADMFRVRLYERARRQPRTEA